MKIGKLEVKLRRGHLVVSWDGAQAPARVPLTGLKELELKQIQPSNRFEWAFRQGIGTVRATCELCGVHIASKEGLERYGEDGELEEFLAKMAADPQHYQLWDDNDDAVSLGAIEGRQFVFGCACWKLGRYEHFIWNHREQIAEYFKARATAEIEDRASEVKRLQEVSGVEKVLDTTGDRTGSTRVFP